MFDEAKPRNPMKGPLRPRILAGLVLTFCLLAPGQFEAKAQSGQASGNATVKSDSLTVYSQMSTASLAVKLLKQGDEVTVDLEIRGASETWCSLRDVAKSRRLGYVLCRYLERAPIPVSTGKWEGTVEVLRGSGSRVDLVASEPPTNPARTPDLTGDTFAPNFTLRDLDGNALSLSGLRGRVVLLDFWATWCGPCRMQMPHLEKLHREFGGRGLVVIGINVAEPQDLVRRFLDANRFTFTALLDPNGVVAGRYRAHFIPTTVFIDAQGKVAVVQYGWGNEQDLRMALRKAGLY
jgi:thiol-disulfide isomerase/thioredoxin